MFSVRESLTCSQLIEVQTIVQITSKKNRYETKLNGSQNKAENSLRHPTAQPHGSVSNEGQPSFGSPSVV